MDRHVDHVTPSFVDVDTMEKVGVFIVQCVRQDQQNMIIEVGSHLASIVRVFPPFARAKGPIDPNSITPGSCP